MLHVTGRDNPDQGLTSRQLADHHVRPPDLKGAVRIATRPARLTTPFRKPRALAAGPGPQSTAVDHLDDITHLSGAQTLTAGDGSPAKNIVRMRQIYDTAQTPDPADRLLQRKTSGDILLHIQPDDFSVSGGELNAGNHAR